MVGGEGELRWKYGGQCIAVCCSASQCVAV